MVIKPVFKSASDFLEGYAQVNENKNNYIDKHGNLIISGSLRWMWKFPFKNKWNESCKNKWSMLI